MCKMVLNNPTLHDYIAVGYFANCLGFLVSMQLLQVFDDNVLLYYTHMVYNNLLDGYNNVQKILW